MRIPHNTMTCDYIDPTDYISAYDSMLDSGRMLLGWSGVGRSRLGPIAWFGLGFDDCAREPEREKLSRERSSVLQNIATQRYSTARRIGAPASYGTLQ